MENNEDMVSAMNAISSQESLGITVTREANQPHDLRTGVEDGQFVFYWGDRTESLFGEVLGASSCIPRTLPLKDKHRILNVIRAFASFKYPLSLVGEVSEEETEKRLQVDLKKITGGLKKVVTGDNLLGVANYVPIGPSGNSAPLCLTVHHRFAASPGLYVCILYFSSDLGIRNFSHKLTCIS